MINRARILSESEQNWPKQPECVEPIESDHGQERHVEPLGVDEMNKAEKCILRYVQYTAYQDELKSDDNVKKTSSIFKLDPVVIDDLLRVGGRIKHAPIDERNKHQIILPKDHHVSKLIVRHYHHLSGHSGQDYVLSLVRSKYWIVHGRSSVKRVLIDFVDCRRRQISHHQ